MNESRQNDSIGRQRVVAALHAVATANRVPMDGRQVVTANNTVTLSHAAPEVTINVRGR